LLRCQFNWVSPVVAVGLIEVLAPNKSPIKKDKSCWGFGLTAGAGTIADTGAGPIELAGAG